MAKQKSSKSSNGATVGYEQQLWQMADALLAKLISGDLRVKYAERIPQGVGI